MKQKPAEPKIEVKKEIEPVQITKKSAAERVVERNLAFDENIEQLLLLDDKKASEKIVKEIVETVDSTPDVREAFLDNKTEPETKNEVELIEVDQAPKTVVAEMANASTADEITEIVHEISEPQSNEVDFDLENIDEIQDVYFVSETEPEESGVSLTENVEAYEEELWSLTELETADEILTSESEQPVEDAQTLVEILPISTVELGEKLETLPEEKIEEAAAILEVVIQTVERLKQNKDAGETDIELVTAGLEAMIERLFACLEIEYDEDQVSNFVRALMESDIHVDFETLLDMQDEGTHERKQASIWIMAILRQPLITPKKSWLSLGKYITRLTYIEYGILQAA